MTARSASRTPKPLKSYTPSKLNIVSTMDDITPTQEKYSFDFEAPKYHDFSVENDNADDSWFDHRVISPPEKLKENYASSAIEYRSRSPRIANTAQDTTKILSKRNPKSPGGVKKRTRKMELTVPKPFNLSTTAIKSTVVPNSPFESLINKVSKFHTKAPDRLKVKAKKRKLNSLTVPHSPMLVTRLRAKPAMIPSTEEREAQEMANIKPIKAQKLNKKILKTVIGVPELKRQPLTIPQSPAIHKQKPWIEKRISPDRIIKANPVPDLSKAFKPILEHRVVQPDSVELPGDRITKSKLEKFKEKVSAKEKERKEAANFVAQPLPDLEKRYDVKHTIKVTEPDPFLLETDQRGMLYEKQLKDKLEKEKMAQKIQMEFHAKPNPTAEPFVPEKSSKPLTEVEDIMLSTEIRAEQRAQFEEENKQRLQRENEEKERLEQKRLELEAKEIRKMRKQAVHKAQPIRNFAKVTIQPSSKPLTEPQSPMIGKKAGKNKKR